jgi:proline dehydrogenase
MDRRVLVSANSLKRIPISTSQVLGPLFVQRRPRSSASSASLDTTKVKHGNPPPTPAQNIVPPLSVMPTRVLLRTLMVTYILSSPRIVKFSIPIMHRISHSKSWLLNPDRNPLLHSIVRKSFYDHFCAGENEKEVKTTIATIKKMGFEGVILGYAKETIVEKGVSESEEKEVGSAKTTAREKVVQEWTEGTLLTLRMLGPGDFLAVK